LDVKGNSSAKDARIDSKVKVALLFIGKLNTFNTNTDVEKGYVSMTRKVDIDVDKAITTEWVDSLKEVVDVNDRLSVFAPVECDGDLD